MENPVAHTDPKNYCKRAPSVDLRKRFFSESTRCSPRRRRRERYWTQGRLKTHRKTKMKSLREHSGLTRKRETTESAGLAEVGNVQSLTTNVKASCRIPQSIYKAWRPAACSSIGEIKNNSFSSNQYRSTSNPHSFVEALSLSLVLQIKKEIRMIKLSKALHS